MSPLIRAIDGRGSPDRYNHKPCSGLQPPKSFASVTMEEGKPFDFLRIFCEVIIAGGTAGVIVESALYPIDTIKTRLQAAHGGGKIVWKGLYSGLAGNLAGTAGAIGGAASSLIRVPTEVVKQRMQTGQFASAPEAVHLIVAKEGFGGLYAGYRSFLLHDLPFDVIQFCIYEQLRIGYKLAAHRDLTDPEIAVIGAFAGVITGAVTTPLDVIKTRLMTQGSANQYRGMVDCVQTVVREEGPSALLKMLLELKRSQVLLFKDGSVGFNFGRFGQNYLKPCRNIPVSVKSQFIIIIYFGAATLIWVVSVSVRTDTESEMPKHFGFTQNCHPYSCLTSWSTFLHCFF